MVPQGCPCPGVGGACVSGPQLQSLRAVLALMWVAYSYSPSAMYPVGMDPLLPRAHLQPHVPSAVPPSASLSGHLLTSPVPAGSCSFLHMLKQEYSVCSSDQLEVWCTRLVSVPM